MWPQDLADIRKAMRNPFFCVFFDRHFLRILVGIFVQRIRDLSRQKRPEIKNIAVFLHVNAFSSCTFLVTCRTANTGLLSIFLFFLLCFSGKKYCYGSMEGQYCHCDYCKCKHGYGSKGYGKCHWSRTAWTTRMTTTATMMKLKWKTTFSSSSFTGQCHWSRTNR